MSGYCPEWGNQMCICKELEAQKKVMSGKKSNDKTFTERCKGWHDRNMAWASLYASAETKSIVDLYSGMFKELEAKEELCKNLSAACIMKDKQIKELKKDHLEALTIAYMQGQESANDKIKELAKLLYRVVDSMTFNFKRDDEIALKREALFAVDKHWLSKHKGDGGE